MKLSTNNQLTFSFYASFSSMRIVLRVYRNFIFRGVPARIVKEFWRLVAPKWKISLQFQTIDKCQSEILAIKKCACVGKSLLFWLKISSLIYRCNLSFLLEEERREEEGGLQTTHNAGAGERRNLAIPLW